MNSKLHLLLTSIACSIWVIGRFINVYWYKLVGAIYELLWLPLLVGIPALTVLAFILWKKEKFNRSSLFFISLLIISATVVITIST